MKHLQYLLLAASFVALAACAGEGAPTDAKPAAADQNFSVTYLFEVDGCKVYRFYDNLAPHYFTTCVGSVTSAKPTKGGTFSDEIQTVKVTP